MPQTTVQRSIQAPIERVFSTIADIRNFSKAVSDITNVEFLSDTTSGVSTRFRETRIMNGKEATTELEVTEYVENQHIRIVSDTHGTVWDTVFTVENQGGQTLLRMVMDAKPHNLASKLMIPMTKGFIQKALEKDMDSVKKYCESNSQ